MKKKILYGILSFVMCLTFGLGCYFVSGGKISLPVSTSQPPEQTQTDISGNWSSSSYSSDAYKPAEGTGASNNPYKIKTPENLAYFFSAGNQDLNKYFRLEADLNMSAHYWTNNGEIFNGFFDGNNHTITGLHLDVGQAKDGNSNMGLFYVIGGNGAIEGISNLEVVCELPDKASVPYIGGLAAECMSETISNVNVNFKLETGELANETKCIGGLVGYSFSNVTFENCTANVEISAGTLSSNSSSHDNMSLCIGGLVGYVSAYFSSIANFNNCNTYGSISYKNPYSRNDYGYSRIASLSMGGIVGQSDGRIAFQRCKNVANIYVYGCYFIPKEDAIALGGILGRLANKEGIIIPNIYAGVESYGYQPYNSIEYCINDGFISVINTTSPNGDYFYIGGICGLSDGGILIMQCYNTADLSPGPSFSAPSDTYWYRSGLGGIIGGIQMGEMNTELQSFSIVTDCLNNATRIGLTNGFSGGVGGIVGTGSWFKINRCVNKGYVCGDNYVGGIVGRGRRILIGNSVNEGTVRGRGNFKGQIVSATTFRNNDRGKMYNCYGNKKDGGVLSTVEGLSQFTEIEEINCDMVDFSSTNDTTFFYNNNDWYFSNNNVVQRRNKWFDATSITFGSKIIESGLLGWTYIYGAQSQTYFEALWKKVDGIYYPLSGIGTEISIAGIYVNDNGQDIDVNIADSRSLTILKQQPVLRTLFKSINFGYGKDIYVSGDSSVSKTFDGVTIQRIVIECVEGVEVTSVKAYREGINDFQRDLNIQSSSSIQKNTFEYWFDPMFGMNGNLSCPLYIYVKRNQKTTVNYSLIEGNNITPISATAIGNYINVNTNVDNTNESYFQDGENGEQQNIIGSITMTLFNTISFQFTPKFGYAFYGISSMINMGVSNLTLDLANNTQTNRDCQSVGGNDVKGTIGNGINNDFYLGVIEGSFSFYAQNITVFLKPITYGVRVSYPEISTSVDFNSTNDRDLYDALTSIYGRYTGQNEYNHSNGYYFEAFYQASGGENSDWDESNKLKTFVDTDDYNHGEYASIDSSYYILEFGKIRSRAEELNDIQAEFLHVKLRRTAMKTTVTLNDYQNYFYDLDSYNKVEDGLTKFDEIQTQTKDDFTADEGSASFTLKPVKGYKTDYISVANDRYYAKNDEDRKELKDLTINTSLRTFDLKNIYVQYLESLSDAELREHMSIEGISQDRTTTINLYIYYSLMTYKVSVTTELVNRDENPASSASLSTNEDNGDSNYTNESAYTAELPSEIHYYSGLKLDLKVAEGERLAGIYFGIDVVNTKVGDYNLVDISPDKALTFYYLNTNDGADTLKIVIRFAKYDVGEAPNLIRGVYYISEPKHLQWLSYQVAMGNDFKNYLFKQTQDIDMSGFELNPIGGVLDNGTIRAFKGTYDGNFYRITNLSFIGGEYQNNLSYMGLFGYVEDATIMHLMVEGASSFTGWANVGGVVGYAKNSTFTRVDNRSLALSIDSTPNNRFNFTGITFIDKEGTESETNTVVVRENYGGLVGYAEGCSFLGCSNQAGVDGAAGLVGTMNDGLLDQCFTTQNSLYTRSTGNIKDCYYINNTVIMKIGTIDESVWTTVNDREVLKIFYWYNKIPQN